MTTLPIVRSDMLSENANYPDTGCEYSPSCLSCKRPVCKYDQPKRSRAARDVAIYQEHLKGRTNEFMSKKFSRSIRVITRAIQQQRDALPLPEPAKSPNDGQLLTLAQLEKKSVIHARKPWPEMKR